MTKSRELEAIPVIGRLDNIYSLEDVLSGRATKQREKEERKKEVLSKKGNQDAKWAYAGYPPRMVCKSCFGFATGEPESECVNKDHWDYYRSVRNRSREHYRRSKGVEA